MGLTDYSEIIASAECSVFGELEQKRKSGEWMKRFCAICHKEFLCFKSPTDGKPQVKFPLEGFIVQSCEIENGEEESKLSFKLSKPGAVDILFATSTPENLNKWIQKLILAGVELRGNSHDLHFSEEAKTGSVNLEDQLTTSEDINLPDTPDVIEITDDVDGNAVTRSKQNYTVNPSELNAEEFPSLDIAPVTLVTPLLHTSQSFDEANLNKIKEPVQLKRSDEIEDLLHLSQNDDDDDDDILIIKDKTKLTSDSDCDSVLSSASNVEEETNLHSLSGLKDEINDNVAVEINNLKNIANPYFCLDDALVEDKKFPETNTQHCLNEIENTEDTNSSSVCEKFENKEEDIKQLDNENDASLANPALDNRDKASLDRIEAEEIILEEKINSMTINDFEDKEKENKQLKNNSFTSSGQSNSHQYVGSIKRPLNAKNVGEDDNPAIQAEKTSSQLDNSLNCERNSNNKQEVEKQLEPIMNNNTENMNKNISLLEADKNKSLCDDVFSHDQPEIQTSTLQSDTEILKKVSVSDLKEIFSSSSANNSSFQKKKDKVILSERNQLAKKNSCKTDDLSYTKKKNEESFIYPNLPQPEIESSVNITFESSLTAVWKRVWGVISGNTIKFIPNKGNPECLLSVPATGLDVQPGAWDTGRLLAFKLMRNKKLIVIIEPDDVENLGRWVSGLFRIIQQPVSQEQVPATSQDQRISSPSSSTLLSSENYSDTTVNPNGDTEAVSVKEIRALFEEMKLSESNPFSSTTSIASQCSSIVQSISSSQNHSLLDSTGSNHSIESHQSEELSFHTEEDVSLFQSPKLTYLRENLSIEKRMMARFGEKYADVVCWLGRYIEQDQEQEILAKVCNPFLAKLRLRHKIEIISKLENSVDEKEKEIQCLKEKITAKQATKDNVQEKYRGRLIRNAEDARRVSDDQKKIDKDCANLENRIKKLEKDITELIDTIEGMHQEIQMDYEKFEYLSSNGAESVQTVSCQPAESKAQEELPEWTKKAKEKTEAWKTLSKEL